MNIAQNINIHVSALINSAIIDYQISNKKKQHLISSAVKSVTMLIDTYTQKILKKTQFSNISSFFSSTVDYSILNVKCSIIWQFKIDIYQIEQMIVDFIIEFMFDTEGLKLIRVYDKIPKIYESGLYEVNDRAIYANSKIPTDLIQFI